MDGRKAIRAGTVTLVALTLLAGAMTSPAGAADLRTASTASTASTGSTGSTASIASTDPSFFQYSGTTPLGRLAPGTVLKTRRLSYHVLGIRVPLSVTQVLYRSTDAQGRAIAATTSVIRPPGTAKVDQVVSYQSAYDSLNPDDGPSRSIAGDLSLGLVLAGAESAILVPVLLAGYPVVMTDTEGPEATFAAGPAYGRITLDALRAAAAAPGSGVTRTARIGLVGYSGGAIASNWAAALAPTYAPEVNRRLVGVAEGGVLVDPADNLTYVDGSLGWAGVMVMALIGVSRAYDVPIENYVNDYGRKLFRTLENASIANALAQYPRLTWKQIAKPRYPTPASVPVYPPVVNRLTMGSAASPTIPMFVGQGTRGDLEGTSGTRPGIGEGDGVMIAGDVRSLMRQYCADGVRVTYQEYPLSHTTTVAAWAPAAVAWLAARLGGTAAPENCATIRTGNSLAPVPSGDVR